MAQKKSNKFCSLTSLTNESSVEQFFIIRLLGDMGYNDAEIKTKSTIDSLIISRGRKKELYKPDYVCYVQSRPRLVIDAKGTEEDIDDYIYQCSGYSLALNRKYTGDNPIQYFMLSNGIVTKVFRWDEDKPLISLNFSDFNDIDPRYQKLKSLISRSNFLHKQISKPETQNIFEFRKPDTRELNGMFMACHNLIWKKEKINPTEAFYKFSKLMFIKLDQDKKLKERIIAGDVISKSEIPFSVHWIEEMEKIGEQNPFDTVLFRRLCERLETEINEKKKKRIFEKTERLELRPSTIKEVTKILQHLNLHGIDEDLNGRLFETFLNATIRGRDLGQYFTPRSVVKFMVKLADLQVSETKLDKILDACCGTGGFLIEAMAEMSNKIKAMPTSNVQKEMMVNKLRIDCLYGIDANKIVTRIARINMYLHGDGGSRIYNTDALDKEITIESGIEEELKNDLLELRRSFHDHKYNVVLTNPPFAMKYESKKSDELDILNQYTIAKEPGTNQIRPSLKSSVMFLERYYDLLDDHGKLLTIMDESVLNTSSNSPFRQFLRDRFIIKSVISLPKNTFVKADSGVKTSVLYLVKKSKPEESQPPLFMAISENVGHTDSGKYAPELSDLEVILDKFKEFERGALVV